MFIDYLLCCKSCIGVEFIVLVNATSIVPVLGEDMILMGKIGNT
jgi:hypothetical protein